MVSNQTPQKSSLSLYANLLDNDAPGTIQSAPVTYNNGGDNFSEQDEAAKKQQALTASIRFQPTKRPQLAAQKAKAKAIASKLAGIAASVPSNDEKPISALTNASSAPKTSAADWAATISEDEDTNAYYAGTRTRSKKRKKKNNNKSVMENQQDWDDIYDPSRPNNYEEYKNSEEKIREVREWKDLLYRHRMRSRRSSSLNSEQSEHDNSKKYVAPSMSFAPPPNLNDDYSPPPPPPSEMPNDALGDDAYMRRFRISQPQTTNEPAPTPSNLAEGQIARAPVRYDVPTKPEVSTTPEDVAESGPSVDDQDTPRSSRPGQKGFAERLLGKYGWTKGSGLGAQGQGIINPLYAKADKRKKKSDAEGGGYVTPATTGKILGGDKSKTATREETKFGAMSEVIRLEGMLDGMDVQAELSRTDDKDTGGLMQEIGEECGEKYGSVERIFIHIPDDENTSTDAFVFVHFVSQLSALRAVNALEGRIFNGNTIKAKFWDREDFDRGIYVKS